MTPYLNGQLGCEGSMSQHDTLEKLRDFFHAHEPFQLARIDDGRIQLHLTDEQYSVIRAALSATQPAQAAQSEPTLRDYADDLVDAGHDFWKACKREAGGGAVRWLSCDDGTLIVFTRGEYRHQIMSVVSGDAAPTTVFKDDGIEAAQTAQGWKLTGEAIPVLYTDTINDQQVMRDDVWLCTTAALKTAQAAADALERVKLAGAQLANIAFNLKQRVGHTVSTHDAERMEACQKEWDAALATHQQGGSK